MRARVAILAGALLLSATPAQAQEPVAIESIVLRLRDCPNPFGCKVVAIRSVGTFTMTRGPVVWGSWLEITGSDGTDRPAQTLQGGSYDCLTDACRRKGESQEVIMKPGHCYRANASIIRRNGANRYDRAKATSDSHCV